MLQNNFGKIIHLLVVYLTHINLYPFSNKTIKKLQGDQQYDLAEEVQKILGVGQHLRTLLQEQQTKNVEMQDEVANAVGKVAAAFQISQTDQDTIERLKIEIGITFNLLLTDIFIIS